MDGCLFRALGWFFVGILPTLFSARAFADSVNNEWYSTTRSQSMGNVGVASAEDATTAMFYNPAALARSKKAIVEIFNPQFEVGMGVLSGSGLDLAKHGSLGKVRPVLQKNPNRVSSVGAAIYPNLSAQNFNFGILARGQAYSYDNGTSLYYGARYLLVPSLGLSMSALGGRFRLGVAVRGIQATDNDRIVASSAGTGAGYTVDAGEGFGVGLDAGALLSAPWPILPTFGFVARNVGDTTFTSSAPAGLAAGNVTRHEKTKMTYDAGFSIFPKIGRRSGMVLAADYRDLLKVTRVTTARRINVGFEFNLNKVLFLRAGLTRGYWTAGFGLGSKFGSLDIGTYAEELDARSFRVKEDRRISIRYGSRF